MEAADDLLFGFDEVERRMVELGRAGDDEDDEGHDADRQEVPGRKDVLDSEECRALTRLVDDHGMGGQGA